jgi:hypothetical protein
MSTGLQLLVCQAQTTTNPWSCDNTEGISQSDVDKVMHHYTSNHVDQKLKALHAGLLSFLFGTHTRPTKHIFHNKLNFFAHYECKQLFNEPKQ